MKAGKLYEGKYTAHPKGFGFVTVEGFEEDFYIPEQFAGDAFHLDEVRIETLPARRGHRIEARVDKVLSHEISTIVGTYEKDGKTGFIRSDDARISTIVYVPEGRDLHALPGQKVVAYITDYKRGYKKPEAVIVEILGFPEEPGVDVTSVVKAYDIPTEFTEDVMAEAESVNVPIPASEYARRTDFRDEVTVTIDGDDSKDLDDAISLTKKNGHYVLGVHIADVSHYVKEGSALDEEARRRGTSVYLVDRVIPMLPTTLSNGICSLNEGEDRLSLSCVMNIDKKGKVTSYKILESVIRSNRRMTYSNVNKILEDHDEALMEEYEELVPMFSLMAELAQILKKRRDKRGNIDFDFTESHIILDEKGVPVGVEPYERRLANKLIEEFMLLANETVARDALKKELPFVFRSHGQPDGEKISELKHLVGSLGYTLSGDPDDISPKDIQKLLKKIKGEPEEYLISTVTLRSMQQAIYTTDCQGHFGLAAEHYCHFTSPIRRYPDLIIHRIIKENKAKKLRKKRRSYYDGLLPALTSSLSKLERRADEVEREVNKLKKVQYMSAHVGEQFSGVISGVTKWGIYVVLPDTVEGMIPITGIRDDHYVFDEDSYQVIGTYTHRSFTLGQEIDIIVDRADVERRVIDFILPEDYGLKTSRKETGKKKKSGRDKSVKKNAKRKIRSKKRKK
ncbi:MAG: ribonuclease R [Lachnospiraceae bacterium]|nr:ribonuclease R [Lachnospiraceae bacterium]